MATKTTVSYICDLCDFKYDKGQDQKPERPPLDWAIIEVGLEPTIDALKHICVTCVRKINSYVAGKRLREDVDKRFQNSGDVT